jgi:hypothetical protein
MNSISTLSLSEALNQIQRVEQEQRIILHNNLIQRILKLRDKLSGTVSLTEISDKLDELERSIYSGSDLEEIEEEIIIIEKLVSHHFHSLLQFIIHEEIETPEIKANHAIHHARDTNHAEKK